MVWMKLIIPKYQNCVKPNESNRKPNVSMTTLKVKPTGTIPEISTDCSNKHWFDKWYDRATHSLILGKIQERRRVLIFINLYIVSLTSIWTFKGAHLCEEFEPAVTSFIFLFNFKSRLNHSKSLSLFIYLLVFTRSASQAAADFKLN